MQWDQGLVIICILVVCKQTSPRGQTRRNKRYGQACKFEPNWESLDKRKAPKWYDKAKFGIFMHWGVYSVPSFGSEWFWQYWKGENNWEYDDFMRDNYPPGFTYQEFAPKFTAQYFNANRWADIVQSSGARYFVFTTKHHEGFTNWPSNVSWNWNSVDIGPHQDLVGALESSIRERTNATFGLYFSLYEWFNPTYIYDKNNEFKTQEFVEKKVMPQLYDLVRKYKPEYIWSDGDWETTSKYWKSAEFLSWLYNESPVKDTILVNDRWGIDCNCKHGDVKTCQDRYNPGKLQPFKWENAMTIDKKSWGFRREAELDDYMTIEELIKELAKTVSYGGNMLMNIGPTADGRIVPIYEERLKQMGKWLKINGDAIFSTKPWRVQKEKRKCNSDVWFTTKNNTVYAIMCRWPKENYLMLPSPKVTFNTKIEMLGVNTNLRWISRSGKHGVKVYLDNIPLSEFSNQWAWTFKFTNIS